MVVRMVPKLGPESLSIRGINHATSGTLTWHRFDRVESKGAEKSCSVWEESS